MAALPPIDASTPFGQRRAGPAARALWQVATMGWPPRIKRRVRRVARRHAGPFDVDLDADGKRLRFRTYPAENYCDRVVFGQGRLPEHREHSALVPYLVPGMTFVDIGANVGAYSLFVAAHAPGARILAFEPHPRTARKLRFNLTANGADAQVVEAAVGRDSGTMRLWSDGGGNVGQTSLLPEATSNAKVSVDVAVVPLAAALAERDISHIDLLKIDVEGFEDRALSPLLASSPRAAGDLRPRAILLEEEHAQLWETDLRALLRERGYSPAFRTEQNVLYVLGA